MEELIHNNLKNIQQRIKVACYNAHRDPESVRLLLATKTVDPERIKMAMNAGYSLIAENKIQETIAKYEDLKSLPHENHFIGHLQTNKVKFLIQNEVKCLHSLDRKRLADRLQNRLEYENKEMDVLIQVNTSQEASKFGVSPDEALDFIRYVATLKNIHIKGLMTIGLFSAEEKKVRHCFRLLRSIRDQATALNLPGVEMTELSMGMSGDLEIAIEEGATMVRVGTAIFGARPYPDSYYWNENS